MVKKRTANFKRPSPPNNQKRSSWRKTRRLARNTSFQQGGPKLKRKPSSNMGNCPFRAVNSVRTGYLAKPVTGKPLTQEKTKKKKKNGPSKRTSYQRVTWGGKLGENNAHLMEGEALARGTRKTGFQGERGITVHRQGGRTRVRCPGETGGTRKRLKKTPTGRRTRETRKRTASGLKKEILSLDTNRRLSKCRDQGVKVLINDLQKRGGPGRTGDGKKRKGGSGLSQEFLAAGAGKR